MCIRDRPVALVPSDRSRWAEASGLSQDAARNETFFMKESGLITTVAAPIECLDGDHSLGIQYETLRGYWIRVDPGISRVADPEAAARHHYNPGGGSVEADNKNLHFGMAGVYRPGWAAQLAAQRAVGDRQALGLRVVGQALTRREEGGGPAGYHGSQVYDYAQEGVQRAAGVVDVVRHPWTWLVGQVDPWISRLLSFLLAAQTAVWVIGLVLRYRATEGQAMGRRLTATFFPTIYTWQENKGRPRTPPGAPGYPGPPAGPAPAVAYPDLGPALAEQGLWEQPPVPIEMQQLQRLSLIHI